ncbi:LOW QUALITY PROTEIN: hypothetical protein Cgig2_015830 [Carnegiea gigantea]|uniref:Uncharacterized protein n=1 Tax=Carnegiea gigantea TaxID=171969 RepID=A0A9Q1KI93_9CARY|nr:LOW QUALITY PROTEIN: hypothetical protein Cgig2_015830 [Carnegiea gigantea]
MDIGLGGLESDDLRGLNQPTTCAQYEAGDVCDSKDEYTSTDDDFGCNEDDGLLKWMMEIFPESKRRICDVHYYRNFSKDHPGAKSHLLFWAACNAYTKHVYKRPMDAIKRESKKAYEWPVEEPIEHWAKFTFDSEVKWPYNTTNFLEGNSCKLLQIEPSQPINRRVRVKLLFAKAEKESRGCTLALVDNGIFEHPLVKIKRGRPQTEKRRDIIEMRKDFTRSNSLKCSLCKQFGHNKRGTDKPSYKEKRGKRKTKERRPPIKEIKDNRLTFFLAISISNFICKEAKTEKESFKRYAIFSV